ncbi:lipid A deacylase LpxR family protein [Acetobacter senegalensis]|uniref:lipid A deacylase LpxR family protein n=1 Tax=Acetobacter senegalensis TaxID=446692 RepID=UPI0020A1B041|nr:lipid A deacylase LpxR family protein [Acetobacter senegalensis]MCP1195520.1 lipid A deacylase LpxR family protein [Acetobacter senegalensis]
MSAVVKLPRVRHIAATTLLLAGGALGSLSTAEATPLQDKQGTWTLQGENDAVSTLKSTSDQYYTSGLRLNWTSGTDTLPTPIAAISKAIWGEGVQRISMGLQQMIFTPRDTQSPSPWAPGQAQTSLLRDRPYASVLLGTINLISDTDTSRSVFGIQVGVMGPAGLGRQLQNGFHGAIGDTKNQGWSHQLQNQPIFQVQGGRTWRLPLVKVVGIEMDMLPSADAAIGDYQIYGRLGDMIRIGQGLNSDFGIPTIGGSGTDGTDAYKATRPFAWYFFGGVTGEAVGYDATLQGNTMRSNSLHVNKKWDVGEIHAGLAIMFYGLRVSYSQVWQTQQFDGAKSGLFNYGSLMVSAKF